MNKALSFVRLDFITIKPYLTLKNLIILAAAAAFTTFTSGSGKMSVGILMVYGAIYASYPFAVGEKNGIDALYSTLSIRRNIVVSGRYLFLFILDILVGVIAYVFSFLITVILQKDFNYLESLLVTLVMFLFYSFIQAFQLPMYFKLGYAKAKFVVYLPFIGWPLAAIAVSRFLGGENLLKMLTDFFGWIVANPVIAVILCIILWLAVMFVSYLISCAFYKKRDF